MIPYGLCVALCIALCVVAVGILLAVLLLLFGCRIATFTVLLLAHFVFMCIELVIA